MQYFSLFIVLFGVLSPASTWTDTKKRRFPDGFQFGAASAAYQVEGAWDDDGKSPSIWDTFMHAPHMLDTYNGDVAADSYNSYERDVEMLRELGVDVYRLSISWSRVLPNGLSNKINKEGIQYYKNILTLLEKYNIDAMVTLYHFDLPQYLQDLGGWANPLIVTWFEDYAKVVFEELGDKVKYWITINQPNSICIDGYNTNFAPGLRLSGVGDYMCVRHVLLAHATAYRLYEKNRDQRKFTGSIGISLSLNWIDPLNNNTENAQATERARAFQIGLYLDPIWSKDGDFPLIVKNTVAAKSKEQGFKGSRLPVFSAAEIKLIKGSSDFLGMNHYTTFLAQPSKEDYDIPSFNDDMGVTFTQGEQWKQGKSSWLKSAPYGLYKACIHLNLQYNYPPIFITEHGWSTSKGLRDLSRVDNLRGYLGALLIAMEDGTNMKGYIAWSLMDNVEWNFGVSERFGLYQVDFDSPNKTRTARLSALIYRHIIESRVVDDEWKPDNLKIRISDRRRKVKTEL